MTDYEMEILFKIAMGLIALFLYGLVCYVFGKSKAEVFDDDSEDLEEAFNEAYNHGWNDAISCARDVNHMEKYYNPPFKETEP